MNGSQARGLYEAEPGLVPGSGPTAGTMFAVLYGELVPHGWRGPDPEHDAYSLFVQHSMAMGWLGTAGLWSMNDAGWDHPLAAAEVKVASWFQVEVEAVAGDRPLPVQPFLHCAGETTARAARLHLTAVQVLLPVQGLGRSERVRHWALPSMRTVHWFGEADPESRTRVKVCLDLGADRSNPVVAQQLKDRLDHLDQKVFECTSYDVGRDATGMSPPFDDSFWNGPPVQRLTFAGELGEWSLDAIGWLAEILADCVARLGGHSPIVLTIEQCP